MLYNLSFILAIDGVVHVLLIIAIVWFLIRLHEQHVV
jgi:hypothetical protein